ncbi:MAG: glycosyltransferase [Anaerolineales bacterium]
MTILFVHNYYQQPGGEDRVFETEAALLESNGHRVQRYTLHNDDIDTMHPLAVAGETLWNRRVYREMREVIRRVQPRIVHCHNTFPRISPSVYYAARAEGIPVVQRLPNYRLFCAAAFFFRQGQVCEECLGKAIPWSGVVHACYRGSRVGTAVVAAMLVAHRALRTWQKMVDVFIALTEFGRQKFIEGGLPADKIVVKPNFLYPDPGPGPGGGDYVLFVGRLSPEKGIETLLAAWRRLRGQIPLKIVGDGPLASLVEEAARQRPDVEWLGRLPKEPVLSLMREAQALVFPSIWYEGFPVVIVEAFAVGLPVVASNLGNMASLIEPGRTGVHFSPGDPDDLVGRIEWLLAHPAKAAAIRAQARAEFEAKYTAGRNYQTLMEIYDTARRRVGQGIV